MVIIYLSSLLWWIHNSYWKLLIWFCIVAAPWLSFMSPMLSFLSAAFPCHWRDTFWETLLVCRYTLQGFIVCRPCLGRQFVTVHNEETSKFSVPMCSSSQDRRSGSVQSKSANSLAACVDVISWPMQHEPQH